MLLLKAELTPDSCDGSTQSRSESELDRRGSIAVLSVAAFPRHCVPGCQQGSCHCGVAAIRRKAASSVETHHFGDVKLQVATVAVGLRVVTGFSGGEKAFPFEAHLAEVTA